MLTVPKPKPAPDEPVTPPWECEAARLGLLERHDRADELAKAMAPMRLPDPEHPHVAYLVGPDMTTGFWHRTTLVDDEPFEHREFGTANEAFFDALAAGGLPTKNPELRKAYPGYELDRDV